MQSLRTPSVWHSAVRFALAIVIADAIVWWIFREGTPVVMGAFAVICLLYFLDYDGTARERIVGYTAASAVGVIAIVLGTVLATPLVVAVLGAFVVSFAFSYARVLRGYVARASVGLQGAFFLPLMADVSVGELPSMLGSWLIGCVVAIIAGLVVFPYRRSGIVTRLIAQWLDQAAHVTAPRAEREFSNVTVDNLVATTLELDQAIHGTRVNPGIVGQRERALVHLVDGTHWSINAFQLFESTRMKSMDDSQEHSQEDSRGETLLRLSSQAFADAALALEAPTPPRNVPNLAQAREADLQSLAHASATQVQQHYPIRLISIAAMRMLWLAGLVRGHAYPKPDLGNDADSSPLALLRLNIGWRSVWFTNALRTGAMTAACVLLVRELGLSHGLWVVLAALSVTQVTFSASSSGSSSLRIGLGAMAGVAVASLGTLLHFPHMVFVILVPVLAFLAVVASNVGVFTAQFMYTPFALANLAAIEWASDRDLELARLENIALGALIAAIFAVVIFPFGLSKQVVRQSESAAASSREYLMAAITVAQGADVQGVEDLRKTALRTTTQLESTIGADSIRPTLTHSQMRAARRADSGSRDRIVGGDACLDLAKHRSNEPELHQVVDDLAEWWSRSPLLNQPGN